MATTAQESSEWSRVVWSEPERMGGEPCFRGSRVPVKTLFDYLEAGEPLREFLDDFPPVTREQVETVIRLAAQSVIKATAA
jgi:uncharacterized protein (DUF433 family)